MWKHMSAIKVKDGTSIEKLLAAADSALYGMKNRGPKQKKFRFTHVAACL